MTDVLLDKRTSISAGEFPKLVTCKWPLGRVTLHRDRIVLDAGVERYELRYSEVDRFRFNAVQVNIEHHDPNVVRDISINGIFIPRIVRNAVRRYGLPVVCAPS